MPCQYFIYFYCQRISSCVGAPCFIRPLAGWRRSGCFRLGTVGNTTARTSPCRRVFTSLGWMPRSGIAGSDDNAATTILWGHATLPKQFCCFSSHHPRLTVPVSHVLTGKCPFHSSHPRGREWRYLAAVSICIALMANHVEHLGMCLLAIYIHIFFGERSFQILYTFKIFITCLFVMELQDFLYILVIYQICDLQTFSLFQGLPFYFL